MIAFGDELIAGFADVATAVAMDGEIGFEGVVLLQQSLDGGHVVAEVFHRQKLLLLADPGFLLFDFGQELLIGQRLVQFLAPSR